MVGAVQSVIHVVHVVTRTNIGGVSSYLKNLINTTATQEIRHTVVRGTSGTDEGDYFRVNRLPASIIDVPALQRSINPVREISSLVTLVGILRQLKPDIVHTHMAKAGVLGRLAAMLCRVPIRIHTFHGHLLMGYFRPTFVRIIIGVEKLLQRVTTWTTVNGDAVRKDLIARGVLTEEQSTNIPPGLSASPTHSRLFARESLNLPKSGQIVGFVGRLAQIKRPDRVLTLARALPETLFIICGDGPLAESLQSQATHLTNVCFMGWVADPSLVYAAIDVLILTSDNEAVPTVLIEAALAGVPCVATDVGSVSEIVEHGDTGFLATSETDLITQTAELLNSPNLRAAFGSRASTRARQHFSLEIFARRHLDLYRMLHQ